MRIRAVCFFIVGVLSIITEKALSFPGDSILVKISMRDTIVNQYEDMVLTVSIQSKCRHRILIPHYIGWGFLKDSVGTGYISIEVQKKEKNSYKNVELDGRIDNLPSENNFDMLGFGDIKEDGGLYFGRTFLADKGDYRIRVLCFTSADNPGIEDVYSDWLYFHCALPPRPK